MQNITFITGNEGKLREARAILADFNVVSKNIDLPEIQEVDAQAVIAAKLQGAYTLHKGAYIVEDTSLYVNALNGLPGPLIKWFLQSLGNDGLAELVHKYEDHSAYASSVIGYITETGETHFFEGRVDGQIVLPQGESDFGWDPIFMPHNKEKTFAQMNAEEKNMISHRKKAFAKFAAFMNT